MQQDDDPGSVTGIIQNLKAGDRRAAGDLWDRYFARLAQLAGRKLRGASRRPIHEDEEDAALSALDSFIDGLQRDKYPEVDDRDSLWCLLVVITARKVVDQLQRHGRQKRGGRLAFESTDLAALTDPEPGPDVIAEVEEQCRRRLAELDDPVLRRVAELKVEGFTETEIGDILGLSRRTVSRRVDDIRFRWCKEAREVLA